MLSRVNLLVDKIVEGQLTKKKSRRASLLFFYLLTASTSIAIAVIKVDMASTSFMRKQGTLTV